MTIPSISKLQPTFLIPTGTQVVVGRVTVLADGATRPAGSVGTVVETPPDNSQPYVVQFTDGQTTEAAFADLTLRRREVEDELADASLAVDPAALRPYVIYRCQVGSKAFGLSHADSDDDLRGIYLPPARLEWSLFRLPEQLEWINDEQDEVYWELEKFLKLALKANPSVLETLWTPLVLDADETARELREIRCAFLSKHLFKTYSGYVLSQFRRMANAVTRTGAYKTKHAMHLIRLLHSGIGAMQTGEIRIDVSEHRDELLRIRNGELKFDEVQARALALEAEMARAFERTNLPDRPDYRRVDALLVTARRRMVDA